MKKIAVVCAGIALALGASMAHATKPGNNGGGNGGCGVGQTTNGCGGSGSNTATGGAGGAGVGVGVGVGIGQGGAGGAGGQGGQGGRGGEGGSVWGSGNSSNVNANTNKQAQGQQQGQAQSSRNSNRNDNRSSATGGNSNATGGNGYASNSNSNANSGNNSDQSVTVNGDNYDAPRIPVATAYSAPLAASNGTCMGSSSAGFQGMAVGISLGTTWNDESCDMRYDAEALRLAGMPLAAVARLCQKAEIADAMKAAGTPFPGTKQEIAAAPPRIERSRVTVDGLQPL